MVQGPQNHFSWESDTQTYNYRCVIIPWLVRLPTLKPRATQARTVLIPNYKYRCVIIPWLVRLAGPAPSGGRLLGVAGQSGQATGRNGCVQGSHSHSLYLIYALLSRTQPCRDYALFGRHFWPKSGGRGHKNILYGRVGWAQKNIDLKI